jgi:hypothetical protein
LQAVLGFTPDNQTLALAAVPPTPLQSEHGVQYTKEASRVKQNLQWIALQARIKINPTYDTLNKGTLTQLDNTTGL